MSAQKFATAPHKEPDTSKKKRKGELWCPYCGEWRKFKYGVKGFMVEESWWRRCTECKIGIEDFWVKKANQLW